MCAVVIANVEGSPVEQNEQGYYVVRQGDGGNLLTVLDIANSQASADKRTCIFLPDGTYDLGHEVLTPISGDNISIIGQSMDKTLIVNEAEKEGISVSATFLITGNNAQYGGGVGSNGGVTIGNDGEAASLTVTKDWAGDNESLRPASTEIELKYNGAVIDRVQLSAAGGWTHTFTGLLTTGSYTVSEVTVPGYTSEVEYSDDGTTATITNTYVPEAVTIRPADVTIYMGGEDGYGSVAGDDGVVPSDSLPVPGFIIELPEALSGVPTEELSLVYENGGTVLTWKLSKYGGGEHNIYRIDPAEGSGGAGVRMTFTNAAGETVTDDGFDLSRYINQDLTMSVYGEGIDEDYVTLRYNGAAFPLNVSWDATLSVRGANVRAEYGGQVQPGESAPAGESGVSAPAGTIYTINNSPVQVDDTSGIALLFDEIIETNDINGVSNTTLLRLRAEEVLGTDAERYELKYLDLVDRNNGNDWVTASGPVTVYWPLPEGTDADTQFTLLHFEGLDREMSVGDVADEIDVCNVLDVDITNDGEHVSFTVDVGGFSPFMLLCDAEPVQPPVYIPGGLNTEDHYAYIIGYEDGSIRPNGSITRAEACTIINRTLGRAPEAGHLLPEAEMNVWPDNPAGTWFYAEMQEATNSHEYKWLGNIEQWLEKLPERDWSGLE